MPGTLLERMWFSCRHQFSWPRRSETGDYYQVCLECGVKYRYDWGSMQRTGRLEHEGKAVELDLPRKSTRKRSSQLPQHTRTARRASARWKPRERRLRIDVPVLYRAKNGLEWLSGRAENISRSGVLFQAGTALPLGSAMELILEMPAEISGVVGAKVVCQATVARVVRTDEQGTVRLAAAIDDYAFLPKGQVAGL